jgi:hypothetical protein
MFAEYRLNGHLIIHVTSSEARNLLIQGLRVSVDAPSNTLSDELVGGNIVLGGDIKTFNLEARFLTGNHKRGGMLEVGFQDIDYPKGEPPQ